MARILWRDAQGNEGAVEFAAGESLVGRAVDCAIRCEDVLVSRHHARLFWEDNRCFVEDLGSANGVFFNEQRIGRHRLDHGDAIRCGSLWLRFIGDGDADIASLAPDSATCADRGTLAQAPANVSGTLDGLGHPPAISEHTRRRARLDTVIPQSPAEIGAPLARTTEQEALRQFRARFAALAEHIRGRGEAAQLLLAELERDATVLHQELYNLRAQQERDNSPARWVPAGGPGRAADVSTPSPTRAELLDQLSRLLANVRINVKAASGEFADHQQAVANPSRKLITSALALSVDELRRARELFAMLADMM